MIIMSAWLPRRVSASSSLVTSANRKCGDTVVESWRRSKSFGVDVDRLDPPLHPDIDLDSKLMRAAGPILSRLECVLAGTRVSVLLTDAQGRVLSRPPGRTLSTSTSTRSS